MLCREHDLPALGEIFPILDAHVGSHHLLSQAEGVGYKILNGWGNQQKLPDAKYWRFKNTGGYEYVAAPDAYDFVTCAGKSNRFQGEFNRTEYVNEIPVSLTRGYYISPFIRANYVLKRVFKHFGYDLQENFFTQTEPFTKILVETAIHLVEVGTGVLRQHILQVVVAVLCITVCLVLRPQHHSLVVGC